MIKIINPSKPVGNKSHKTSSRTGYSMKTQVKDKIKEPLTKDDLEKKLNKSINNIPLHPVFSRKAGYNYYMKNFRELDTLKFSEVIKSIAKQYDSRKDVLTFIEKNKIRLNKAVFDEVKASNIKKMWKYEMLKTLEASYIKQDKITGKAIESPAHRLMRIACSIVDLKQKESIGRVIQSFRDMYNGFYTHATPTLYNASDVNPQMSSCFTVEMHNRTTEAFFETLKKVSSICDRSGGIGIDVSGIGGSREEFLRSLRIINDSVSLLKTKTDNKQKRKGSVKVFLPIWHINIEAFMDSALKTPSDIYFERSNELHYGVVVSDEFMKRCTSENTNETWTVFDPNFKPEKTKVVESISEKQKSSSVDTIRNLFVNSYGKNFSSVYKDQERNNRKKDGSRKKLYCMKIMKKLIECQLQSGEPSVLYIDTTNRLNMLRHKGTIRHSNLCNEIVQLTDEHIGSVCNLASVCLPKFVRTIENKEKSEKEFDFNQLYEIVRRVTRNLNNVVSITACPTKETNDGNNKSRSVAVGVQGFWNLFPTLGIEYGSKKSKQFTALIFETIYYAALTESNQIAKENPDIIPEWFEGSPYSKGEFHFQRCKKYLISGNWNWRKLRQSIEKYGLSNMQVQALMPTVSSSLLTGNKEGIDPPPGGFYTRDERHGTYAIWDEQLVNSLVKMDKWTDDLRKKIIKKNGQISGIDEIPNNLKKMHKYSWEMSMKTHIEVMSYASPFIDQAISMNLHLKDDENGTIANKLFSALTYAWKLELKTGVYYVRIMPTNQPMYQGNSEDCVMCMS